MTFIFNEIFEKHHGLETRHPGRNHEIFILLKTLLESEIDYIGFLKLRYLPTLFKVNYRN